MKIGVWVREVIDTEAKIVLSPDGRSVNQTSCKYCINPYDEFAIEEALKLKDKMENVEVILLYYGRQKGKDTVIKGLAMGADKGIQIIDENYASNLNIAKALKKCIEQEGIDLIFTGSETTDEIEQGVNNILGIVLDMPICTNVVHFELNEQVEVSSLLEDGRKVVERFNLPGIVAVTKGINTPRYTALKGIMQAKKKPFLTYEAETFLQNEKTDNLTVEMISYIPQRNSECIFYEGDSAELSERLVEVLKEEANK